jgi:hypothetical protein
MDTGLSRDETLVGSDLIGQTLVFVFTGRRFPDLSSRHLRML